MKKKVQNTVKTVSEAAVCPYVDKTCLNCRYLEIGNYSTPYCRYRKIDIHDVKSTCGQFWEEK